MYWHQTATVRVEETALEDLELRRSVGQRFIQWPLFNFYLEAVFSEALEVTDAGININGSYIRISYFAPKSFYLLLTGRIK